MVVKGIFFSKNKKTAIARANILAKTEGMQIVSKPRLASKQIPHIAGYKTFSYSWKYKKRK